MSWAESKYVIDHVKVVKSVQYGYFDFNFLYPSTPTINHGAVDVNKSVILFTNVITYSRYNLGMWISSRSPSSFSVTNGITSSGESFNTKIMWQLIEFY